MSKADDKIKRAKIITTLFAAYGQSSDAERMATYVEMLKDIPAEVLDRVCKKAILECKYLPSIAELFEGTQNLVRESNGTSIVPFAQVWEEIMKQLDETYFDWEEGTYSRKEIKQLVDAFGGLRELRMMQTSEVPIIRAQMNKMYDGICARNKERHTNEYVLGAAYLIDSGNEVRLKLK